MGGVLSADPPPLWRVQFCIGPHMGLLGFWALWRHDCDLATTQNWVPCGFLSIFTALGALHDTVQRWLAFPWLAIPLRAWHHATKGRKRISTLTPVDVARYGALTLSGALLYRIFAGQG